MRRQLTPKWRSSLYHPSVPRLGSPDVAETSELRFSQYRIFKNKDSGKHRLGTSGQKYTDEEQTQDHGHSPGSTSRVNTWGLSEIQSLRRRGKVSVQEESGDWSLGRRWGSVLHSLRSRDAAPVTNKPKQDKRHGHDHCWAEVPPGSTQGHGQQTAFRSLHLGQYMSRKNGSF